MFDCLNTAGVGGYAYLLEPLWWLGMITSKCFLLGLFEFVGFGYFVFSCLL